MNSWHKVWIVGGLIAMTASTAWSEEDLDLETKRLAVEKSKVELAKSKLDLQKSALPSSGFTGDAELKDGAGLAEETILSIKAMEKIASKISQTIKSTCGTSSPIVLYVKEERPPRHEILVFETHIDRLISKLATATHRYAPAEPGQNFMGGMPSLGAISLGVNLLSYFKSDYQIYGRDLPEDEVALVSLISNSIKSNTKTNTIHRLYLYSDFRPKILDPEILAKLQKIDEHYDILSKQMVKLAASKATKDKAQEVGLILAEVDEFLGTVTTPDAGGTSPLARVNRAMAIQRLDPRCDAWVSLNAAAGSHYTVKNLWTGLGTTAPFYASATVVASYKVWDADSSLRAAGVEKEATPFQRFDRIAKQ